MKMAEFLKHYKLKIHTLAPVHIGNGEKINKKEYIYLPNRNRVIVPDIERMYQDLRKRSLEKEYMNNMMKESRFGLGQWLRSKGYREGDYQKWERYELDAGDVFQGGPAAANARHNEINCCIKDAYGFPYVPGSSIKGMIRTALLAYEINHHPEKFRTIKEQIRKNSELRAKRDRCLSNETLDLEVEAFHTLQYEEKRIKNAVNCNLSGLIVSDSEPVKKENLILCQKIDYTLDGQEKMLPTLKEALKPETDIYFTISIDETRCPYTAATILQALDEFQKISYQYFYSRFKRGSQKTGTVWLGGGCGFLSKTILYPMFGTEAVRITDRVFRNTLGKNYETHKHTRDMKLKIAPHVCKCTRYHGILYDMGMAKIELIE